MLHLEQNRALKPLTTFKIGGPAQYFASVNEPNDLLEALSFAQTEHLPVLILGGGSNMLISDTGFRGLVVQIVNKGIELLSSSKPHKQHLRIASGEVWDAVVKFAVEHELWGIENLSRIPGRTGAVAVQNVGAYGQEISNVLLNVEAYDRKENRFVTLSNIECGFSYRQSIFNTREKNRYIILYTTLELSKEPARNLSYPDVKKRFENTAQPTLMEIRQAIKEIRDRKFPFPAESIEGNAGSFFKNSLISHEQFLELENKFAKNLPEQMSRLERHKPADDQTQALIKIPSAFILDACGLKGYRRGDVMLNPAQPVIVLNVTGKATADEVLSVVHEVRNVVMEKTGLYLYIEPELIGFDTDELKGYGFNDLEITRFR